MNLLYILGNGSDWDDNELRYSLRSAHAHLTIDRVVVAGHCPSWLCHVDHIPCYDIYKKGLTNTLHKLLVAAADPLLPERFTLMNDDFIFLGPAQDPYPMYTRGTIQQRVSAGPQYESFYYQQMESLLYRLRAEGIKEPLDFDGHHPLPMQKTHVLSMADRYGGSGSTYAWRSVYGNLFPERLQYAQDPKLYSWATPRGPFISLGDELPRSAEFREWIVSRFPSPSPFEERENPTRI